MCTIIFLFYALLPLFNYYSLTRPLSSINLVKDSNSLNQQSTNSERNEQFYLSRSTNQVTKRILPISDLDVVDVSRKLYYDESLLN